MTRPALRRPRAALLCLVCALHVGSPAAAEPDIQAIIEALTPSAARATRNLVVRPRADAATSASVSAPAPAAASAPPMAAGVPAPLADPAAGTVVSGPPPSLALAIQFEANSARVRPESGPVLGSLVAAMQSPALKASRFVIEGHADARGGADQNQRLSQARADEVRLYLVALGVHPARLRAVGRGASAPVNPGDPAAAENRRVRVVTVE